MVRMTINEIQSISFDILKHVNSFCQQRHLTYFLDSGTLLGAAREKGFIPWDDDVDIMMPRPEYDKFEREFVDSDEYKLYSYGRGNSYLPYMRVCDMKKTFFGQHVLWTRDSPGVGIDIFPLDGAPSSPEQYALLAEKIGRAINKIIRLRVAITGRRAFRRSVFGFTKDYLHWMADLYLKCTFRAKIDRAFKELNDLRVSNDYRRSENCFHLLIPGRLRRYWKRSWFEQTEWLDFCGYKLPAPIGYAERLSAEYGDWNTPPPASERMGHATNQTMYWRD